MRLLNVHHLEIYEFDSNSTLPPYVIASHTWEPNGEITYIEFCERRDNRKSGYEKVTGFVHYVKEHVPGVEWLWIDTCCIDQRHSSEVSKAINSMFNWYLNAVVCLAYLQDVQASTDTGGFVGSKWFKRGWTLQELLASRVVVFLTKDWQLMGHKADGGYQRDGSSLEMGVSLNERVAGITGVPEAVLSDFQQSKCLTTEERLRWIDGRATKEPEDMSYSLMGIFDISMPTKYGEGESKARRRLLAEISKDNVVLRRLPVARGAAFDDKENDVVVECLAETRVDLLRDISNWANSRDGACIFWLSGMAGTGKSTVFKTVARMLKDEHRLAASFCFKRRERERGRAVALITTISAQLAQRLPGVRDEIISALEKDPEMTRRSLKEQFQKLILQPLEHYASPPVRGPAWIIGMDALDECDDESDIGVVIDLFARLKELKSANVRLFVTSRPDLSLRLGFKRMAHNTHCDVQLEKIPANVTAHDIAIYLQYKLGEIRSNHARLNGTGMLEQDWPGEGAVRAMVEMAQPLFIFASTVCRLLGEPDEDPHESLRMILDHRLEASQLDRTYRPVLDRLLINKTRKQRDQIVEDFHVVVGSIVILADPLPRSGLARLLNISEEKVNARLQRLHSVLDVPSAGERLKPVRLLHLSFRDYLTDIDMRDKMPFWIDETLQHRTLARQCLRLLSQGETLKQDLCRVEQPGVRRVEISREHVARAIPADVAYACSHWAWHLVKGGERLRDNAQVRQFLELHFLHWLEAMSWLGRLSEVAISIKNLQSVVEVKQGRALLAFLEDTGRFVLRNRYVIDLAPLQTYSSALLFTPRQSVVRKQFEVEIPNWIRLHPRVLSKWSMEIQKLEGHDDAVSSVAFSPDGQAVASGSIDMTVRLWDAVTGEQTHKLEGHDDWVMAVAVSPGTQTVASGSRDKTVRLWNSRTGEAMHKLEGHDDMVTGVAFSPDGQTVVSGSTDKTVRLWNSITGKETHKLEGHDNWVIAVALSPDGQTIASGSWDKTVRLWNTVSGEEIQQLEGHDFCISAIAFSPDGQTIASGSWDRTVRLWNSITGMEIHKLNSHDNSVTAVIFDPDGQTVISGSSDKAVRLWDARKGGMHKLEGHEKEVAAVAISPDGQTIASGSLDKTIRLWNTVTSEETDKLEGHDKEVTGVAFSPDGQLAASGSRDKTVRLWDAETGEEMHKLENCSQVWTVTFSPDGQTVALGSSDNTVQLWNARTGENTHKLEGHKRCVAAVAFSPNGQTIASGADKTLLLWNTVTGKETHKLQGHNDSVNVVSFSPDGQTVAFGSDDKTVRLWDAVTGEQTHKLEGHDGWVIAVAVSLQTVASGSRDKTVRLWSARTGEAMHKLEGHDNYITAIAISPDEQTIASASVDKTIRLWNAASGEQIHCFRDVGRVYMLAFDEYGTSLITDTGTLDLPAFIATSRSMPTYPAARLTLRNPWIRYQGQDVLWLPHEYRGNRSAVYDKTLVIGQVSGAVSFFKIESRS